MTLPADSAAAGRATSQTPTLIQLIVATESSLYTAHITRLVVVTTLQGHVVLSTVVVNG